MRLKTMPCVTEIHPGGEESGALYQGTIAQLSGTLRDAYAGQVQTVYLDPPFNTGKQFFLRQRVGEAGWRTGAPTITLPAYCDQWNSDDAFLAMLRDAARLSYDLLRDDGSLFLHIDSRMHAHARLMLDALFGQHGFVNEIIWAYNTGGRSSKHFSRKHDIILYYRKSPASYFDIAPVGVPRGDARRNHMRRAVDEDGRMYRTIRSAGKEYRYYDDDLVYPGDVWTDVSHLQQKDPQRTGYDNQKPLALLERILLCSTRPGALVADLFGGSGTTAAAALKHGRRFLLVDAAEAAVATARKRLLGTPFRLIGPCAEGTPLVEGNFEPGVGLAEAEITAYELETTSEGLSLSGLDAVDQLSVGFLKDGVFTALESVARSKNEPALPKSLRLPVMGGQPALLTVDILGRRMVHVWDAENA